MKKPTALAAAALLMVAGCSSSDSPDPEASGDGSGGDAASSPGTLFSSRYDEEGMLTVSARTLDGDGVPGEARDVVSESADEESITTVVDGVGDLILTGTFEQYWTKEVQLRRGDEVVRTTEVDDWCGGEGLSYNICYLLDEDRVVRTTTLGAPTDEKPSVLVSSLEDGETLAEHGPFDDLSMLLPTASADEVLLVTTTLDESEQPTGGAVTRLSLTDGETTELGTIDEGWAAICPISPDSVLGFTQAEDRQVAAVVGSASIGDISWSQDDMVVGCSQDGRFLYLQRVPQPPTEEGDESEEVNPPTTVQRVSLDDGSTEEVLTLPPMEYAGPVTR